VEVRVKVESVSKLKLAMSTDKEGALVTQVSFEIPGRIESAARILNLVKQRQAMYCVLGCAQASFDLQTVEVREKDKRTAQSEADKAKAAQAAQAAAVEDPTTGLFYKVVHLASKQTWEGDAVSPEAACEQAGWPIAECRVTVPKKRATRGKAKEEAPAVPVPGAADELFGPEAEAVEPASDNGKDEAAEFDRFLELEKALFAWLDTNATPDAEGLYALDCPFHEDSEKSMVADMENGTYCCTACGSTGPLTRLAERLGILNEKVVEAAS